MNFIGDEAILIYTQEIASKGPRSAPLLKHLLHFQNTEKGGEKPKGALHACAESALSFLRILTETRAGTYTDRFDLTNYWVVIAI
jgi:hypothetical protein